MASRAEQAELANPVHNLFEGVAVAIPTMGYTFNLNGFGHVSLALSEGSVTNP